MRNTIGDLKELNRIMQMPDAQDINSNRVFSRVSCDTASPHNDLTITEYGGRQVNLLS